MSTMRITGMMSGLDTDRMVKDLMKAESMRIDKVKQDRQFIQWQQQAFRDIINKTRSLQSKFMDVLNPSQNLRSPSSFAKFDFNVRTGGVQTNAISVTSATATAAKNMRIEEISQLATQDTISGNLSGLRGIKTSEINDIADFKSDLNGNDFEMTLAVGAQSRVIHIEAAEIANFTNLSDLKEALTSRVVEAFGEEYVDLITFEDGNRLKFDMPGQRVQLLLYSENVETFDALGVTSGQRSDAYRTQSLEKILGIETPSIIKINGKSLTLEPADTLDQMMNKINRSNLGVQMQYSPISDRFTLLSTREGAANNINVDDSNTIQFFEQFMGVDISDRTHENRSLGQNARLVVDGVEIVQSSNTFTLEGISMTLTQKHGVDESGVSNGAPPIEIGVSINADAIIDTIKDFVNEYNELITSITEQRTQRRNYDFKPLTDEQRDAMSEKEIELWEEKAKSGLLRNASELDTFVTRLRNAMIEPIQGVGISMSDIGIKSGSYLDRGAITIDEDKLRTQLENNYDEVVKLFSQSSDIDYGNGVNSRERYNGLGVVGRLDDIIRDYTRTTRDVGGRKGLLIERAGIENDSSITQNNLSKRIGTFDDRIAALERFLISRESYYYQMFSRMESALSQMDAQAGSIMSMFGGLQ